MVTHGWDAEPESLYLHGDVQAAVGAPQRPGIYMAPLIWSPRFSFLIYSSRYVFLHSVALNTSRYRVRNRRDAGVSHHARFLIGAGWRHWPGRAGPPAHRPPGDGHGQAPQRGLCPVICMRTTRIGWKGWLSWH
jgi:hypothetical protein